jgi:hypothetical protein
VGDLRLLGSTCGYDSSFTLFRALIFRFAAQFARARDVILIAAVEEDPAAV